MTTGVERQADWSFVRRPKWVVSHVLVMALIVVMVAAGIWQINRHVERGDRNESIQQRAELEPVALGEVAPPTQDPVIGETEQFRRVEVTGRYVADDEVLIRNRTFDGAPGWWVLTPLVTEDGWAVAVNRGWIPLTYRDDEPRPGTEPPTGEVTIRGTIQPARTAQGLQNSDPASGRLTSLARADVDRLEQQVDYPLSPVVVQLAATDDDSQASPPGAPQPAAGAPRPLPLPALDAGPHLSYAAQWFIFSTIAVVGYPLILRRASRAHPHDDTAPDEEPWAGKESEPDGQRR